MCGRFAMSVDTNTLPNQFTRTVLFHNDSGTDIEVDQVSDDTYTARSEDDQEFRICLKNGLPGFSPSYNVPPTKNAIIIYQENTGENSQFVFEVSSFGLVPTWAQPKNPEAVSKGAHKGKKYSKEVQAHQAKYFNCRKETLAQGSPVWNPVKNHRCVVPIEGYFEWRKEKNDKIPYYIHSSSDPLIFLAGFYSHNSNYKDNFQDPESGYLSTFTIVTGPASKEDKMDLSWLHGRKPLMLKPGSKEWDDWLNPDIKWTDEMLDTCLGTVNNSAYDTITSYIVSNDVGNSANQGDYLIKQVKKTQKGIDSFFRKRPSSNNDSSPKRIKHEP